MPVEIEADFENENYELEDDLGDKIDYNDNLSKISTLATSNQDAFPLVK